MAAKFSVSFEYSLFSFRFERLKRTQFFFLQMHPLCIYAHKKLYIAWKYSDSARLHKSKTSLNDRGVSTVVKRIPFTFIPDKG